MDFGKRGFEVWGGERAIGEIWGNDMRVFGGECMFHGSRARVGGDEGVGAVGGL